MNASGKPLFRLGGTHVPHRKNTAASAPRRIFPTSVLIPMSMHIGAPATPTVAVGDHVDVGQVIGEAGGFVSAPIHSGVSGKVVRIEDYLLGNGRTCPAVRIEADGLQSPFPGLTPPDIHDLDSFLGAVRQSGAVGLGGAGFPTSVKFAIGDKPLHALVLNGAECEPYITSDTRTMLDKTGAIFDGIDLICTYLKPERVVIGVEKNKPDCIAALNALASERNRRPDASAKVEIAPLPPVYPQGGEKVLIYHTTGRVVPEGKLPIDAGCIVLNVTTTAFLAEYAKTGMPLVEKVVTVDGGAVKEPGNLIVPVGTSMKEVFAACGGFREPPAKLLYGGPMMGMAVPDGDAPILKNTNAVLALNAAEAALPESTACIRCARCINHCPFSLEPRSIKLAFEKKDMEALEALHTMSCMECGCCSFICPAHQPLTQTNKLAKAALGAWLKQKKEASAK